MCVVFHVCFVCLFMCVIKCCGIYPLRVPVLCVVGCGPVSLLVVNSSLICLLGCYLWLLLISVFCNIFIRHVCAIKIYYTNKGEMSRRR